jgi:carbamoyltransferase
VTDAGHFVLGVNAGSHDASAALFRDSELLCVAEQERLSRRRWAVDESPARAIDACLSSANISLPDVAAIAVGWNVPRLYEQDGRTYDPHEFVSYLLSPYIPVPSKEPELVFYQHHLAHAASGMWTSGFDEAVVVVLDGRGEEVATTVALGSDDGFQILSTFDLNQSLGHLYGVAAEWAGFGYEGAGKLMGLAGYGKPGQRVPLSTLRGSYNVSTGSGALPTAYAPWHDAVTEWFSKHCFPYHAADGAAHEVIFYSSFAASVQRALEDAVVGLVTAASTATGVGNVVLVGGVALNCSLNGTLSRSSACEALYVPPFPYDTGVAVGAGLLLLEELGRRDRNQVRLHTATLGPPVSSGAVEAGLARVPDRLIEQLHEAALVETIAGHLADDAVIGWWQGPAEVGKRALGNRSILADPRFVRTRSRVNSIKGREPWRPLAPSVLASDANSLFKPHMPPPADFMLAAVTVDEEAVAEIPAAVHVDGTARPHVVGTGSPTRYRKLLEQFRRQTGCPAVVNTSFNLAGEPIVYSVEDALSCFDRSTLDLLVVENYLIGRPGSRALLG